MPLGLEVGGWDILDVLHYIKAARVLERRSIGSLN